MPNIEIAKLKTRRGTNNQRKRVIFDQGEIVSTVDTNRLFLGTGTLSGGVVIGSKVHQPITNYSSLSNIAAEVGDLAYANNIFYQLTASPPSNINNWMSTGIKLDSGLFSYDSDNTLRLNLSSLSAVHINPLTVSNGIKISGGILQSNFNTKSLEISSYQLSLKANGIDERELNSTTFGYGISGGSGTKVVLDVNPSQFRFNGDTLNLTNSTSISAVDNSSLILSSGVISVNNNGASGSYQWPRIVVDTFGRVTTAESSILDVLTGNASLSSYNRNNSLSAIYNGDSMGLSSIAITRFTALSSDGTSIIHLSSAGFITFEGGTTTRSGTSVGRFAIPIYRY
jgi:hypothetical protein